MGREREEDWATVVDGGSAVLGWSACLLAICFLLYLGLRAMHMDAGFRFSLQLELGGGQHAMQRIQHLPAF